jgi:uncharacterized membrane protein YbaN (DUF454 family)
MMHSSRSSAISGPESSEAADATPFREPSVVHTSYGRLRVHLAHWTGTQSESIAAGVCRLSGVTQAEANPLTGNVLIFFDPERTSVAVLLEALPALHLDQFETVPVLPGDCLVPRAPDEETTWHTTVPEQPLGCNKGQAVFYVQGPRAVMYKVLGWSSVGMAVVGAITPGIPTAPFVILAGYFFVRSSPEAHQWLRQSRWFGPILRDWEVHRGVRRSIRNAALALIGGGMAITPLIGFPTPVTITILTLQAIGLGIVLRLRVVEPVSLVPAE